ncbi:MAG: hypothetical protein WBD06_08610 [Acidobacteriaceae bacterium]
MAGNVHDGLVARAALRQFGDERVPVVMPAPGDASVLSYFAPGRFQGRDVAGRIGGLRFAKRKDIPFRSGLPELVFVPLDVIAQHGKEFRVQRNGPALAAFRLGAANGQKSLLKIDLSPAQTLDLGIAHSRIQSECQREVDMRRPGLCRLFQHALFLFLAVCLAEGFANLQLEHLLLAKACANDFARFAQDA